MTEDHKLAPNSQKPWYRAQIALFVGGSIIIAFLLVLVSMALYLTSGAAQLDLSRPGYQAVQNQVKQSDTFSGFSANGPIDEAAIKQFEKLYEDRIKQLGVSDAFSPSVLEDQALGIEAGGDPTQ